MKTNFKTKYPSLIAGVVFATLIAAFPSCKKNQGEENSNQVTQANELTKEEILAIRQAGFSPDGASKQKGGYLVEGDIFLSKAEISKNQEYIYNLFSSGPKTEQFRTTNLVAISGTREIKVKVDAGPSQQVFTNATAEAIKRYNDQNLNLTFRLLALGSSENPDISIIGADLGTSGGGTVLGQSAGFPTNGNPATPIALNNTVYNSTYNNNNLLATVIAHEIGHAIGLRHTDYADRRQSCGKSTFLDFFFASNEGDAGFGAINIPGTPTSVNGDPNSFMLACSNGSNRPFTNYDIIALNALYGKGSNTSTASTELAPSSAVTKIFNELFPNGTIQKI